MIIEPIAYIHTDFQDKFGLPRQSGLVPLLMGEIVFTSKYSHRDAVRGLEQFSHIWLLWEFHTAVKPDQKGWSATVRPPRLGGNTRVGVFASRSPFRPNAIGMSCVKLEKIYADETPVRIIVSGVDLMNETPIYDIKPYIPVADCIPDANPGYTAETLKHVLKVVFPGALEQQIPMEQRDTVRMLLEQDPRPGYADDPERIYGMAFAGLEIRFRVSGEVLTVCEVAAAQASTG
ncbi:MAG: tRNA (N6-threonylcarbamoyladenosine(37)-N6)-methyltransferase TrmO [Oscillospiraceae bacterium]|nr:tRNA (N6-threonylcarbamoyladenosine(37)-N6)-methyltransferase TrmO [Oscillospiraceae bacterium]